MKRPIYYDTETTGIKPDKDRIIELGAYDPLENRSFSCLINPHIEIPAEATAIHHISNAMVKEAPTFAQVGQDFLAFCPENTVLIAHNNDSFDKLFLEAEFSRNGLQIANWSYIDSLKWARKYRPDLPRHSLQHLRESYGIAANTAHRALDDVMVLYQIFSKMIDDLSYDTVFQLLSQSQALTRMPFGKHQGKPLNQIPKSYISWLLTTGAFENVQNKELKENFEKLGLL